MPEGVRTLPEKTSSATNHGEMLIVELDFIGRTWWLLRRAFTAAYQDNCFSIAKGAAYSLLLSLFPVLTTLTAILFEINAERVVHILATFTRQIVPPGTEELILSRLHERGARPLSVPLAAILVSLWAGSGAMMTLMEGFQAAYRIPSGRPFLKQRAMAIFLVFIAALPAVAASSLILFGDRIELAFVHWIGVAELSAPVELLWKIARYIVAFLTVIFVTGLLYYFGPNYRPEPEQLRRLGKSRFMRVWPGALLATILWMIATVGFALYVGHTHYNIVYGSLLGTVVVLLIWLYLVSCIALLGCEYNAERERADSLPTMV